MLHQRYKDFSPSLVQGLLKVFFPGKCGDELDVDKSLRAIKKRSTLKLLMELYFVGVIDDCSILVNIVKDLTTLDHLKDREVTQTNLSLLTSFARQGRFFLGLQQPGQEIYDEVCCNFGCFHLFVIFCCMILVTFYDKIMCEFQTFC